MASHPGYTMEDFVEDIWFEWGGRNFTRESAQFQSVVSALESQREYIEDKLDTYEEEEVGWRDYRNDVVDMLDYMLGPEWRQGKCASIKCEKPDVTDNQSVGGE